MEKKLILIGLVLIVFALIMYLRFKNSAQDTTLLLSGNVEITEIQAGFKIPGRVQSLFTDEGRLVSTGERVAVLDRAELESLVTQYRAGVRNAEAQFLKAQKDIERFEPLYAQGVITAQQMDAARTAFDATRSQADLARAALQTAEVRLKDTMLYSPVSGIVLRKNVEQGETVAAGVPIFTLGDIESPWIKVYIKEDKLGLVKIGQQAEIRTDSYPNKVYQGVISYISSEAEFTPKNIQTHEERVKLVFGIKVKVKNENNELKPGMPADVTIRLPEAPR
ncbi:MAG: efflux RND transporter periplasmic adaptor subunit [Nitrospirota bacterium]